MEELLPPPSAEQFSSLESDILGNGCYAPVIVNEDMMVIDGHNRPRICEKHGLPYKIEIHYNDIGFIGRDIPQDKESPRQEISA